MSCPIEYATIIRGEDRTLSLRVATEDKLPYNLASMQEIRARFKNATGSYIEKRLTEGDITILSETEGRLSVTLDALDTQLMLVAPRQDFMVIFDRGAYASVDIEGQAMVLSDVPGIESNGIELVFTGTNSVLDVVNAYNTANNASLTITGTETYVPTAGTYTLAGGVSERRKVNFKQALGVIKEAL